MWPFKKSQEQKRLATIRQAAAQYRNEFFAFPVNASRLNQALLALVRIAYEESLQQTYPGLKPMTREMISELMEG